MPLLGPPAVTRPRTPRRWRAGLVRAFKQAWEAQDIEALLGLPARDATATGDGGGRADATPHPLEGAGRVVALFACELAFGPRAFTLLERTVNGQPGLGWPRSAG